MRPIFNTNTATTQPPAALQARDDARIFIGCVGLAPSEQRLFSYRRCDGPRKRARTNPNKQSSMPCGRKRKRHKIATHKRKKRLRKNRHKKKNR